MKDSNLPIPPDAIGHMAAFNDLNGPVGLQPVQLRGIIYAAALRSAAVLSALTEVSEAWQRGELTLHVLASRLQIALTQSDVVNDTFIGLIRADMMDAVGQETVQAMSQEEFSEAMKSFYMARHDMLVDEDGGVIDHGGQPSVPVTEFPAADQDPDDGVPAK